MSITTAAVSWTPEKEEPEEQRKLLKLLTSSYTKSSFTPASHDRQIFDKTKSLSTLARNIADFDLLMKLIIWTRFAVDNGTVKCSKVHEDP